jgi:hypothetical protein
MAQQQQPQRVAHYTVTSQPHGVRAMTYTDGVVTSVEWAVPQKQPTPDVEAGSAWSLIALVKARSVA